MFGQTLVLYGDVPLISEEDIDPLISEGQNHLAVLTAIVDEPDGYGRIVRDSDSGLIAIVEHHDASEEERTIVRSSSDAS